MLHTSAQSIYLDPLNTHGGQIHAYVYLQYSAQM